MIVTFNYFKEGSGKFYASADVDLGDGVEGYSAKLAVEVIVAIQPLPGLFAGWRGPIHVDGRGDEPFVPMLLNVTRGKGL